MNNEWKIVADPGLKGLHPYHDNRYIMTQDAEIETWYDSEGKLEWILSQGSIICSLRDSMNQAQVARLIAAAPDMYEALKELERLGNEGMKPDYKEWLTFHDKVAQIARQALAKSEGKE